MKISLTISTLLILISGNALAGKEYDKCIKQEKALKKQEAGDCSGLAYLLNPSACFATQKALKQYTSTDKCKNIGKSENVDFGDSSAIPAEKTGGTKPVTIKAVDSETLKQENACEQLKEENARLKSEIERLKAESQKPADSCR